MGLRSYSANTWVRTARCFRKGGRQCSTRASVILYNRTTWVWRATPVRHVLLWYFRLHHTSYADRILVCVCMVQRRARPDFDAAAVHVKASIGSFFPYIAAGLWAVGCDSCWSVDISITPRESSLASPPRLSLMSYHI